MEFILNHRLINLLKYYNDNSLIADEEFVQEAVKIITKSWQISSLIKDVTISDARFPAFYDNAKYSYETRDLKVNLTKKEDLNDWQILLNKNDKRNTYNLYVLRLIIRECTRIKQLIEARHTDTVKGILLRDSLEDILISKSDLSKEYETYLRSIAFNRENNPKNYAIMPCNRFAEVDAILKIIELYPHLYYANRDLINDYYTYALSKALLLGYGQQCISPTLNFIVLRNYLAKERFEAIAINEGLQKIAKSNDESDNLYLGLPIEKETYNKFHDGMLNTETFKSLTRKNR